MADIKIQFGTNDNGEPVAIGKRFVDRISSLSQTTSDPSSIQYGSLENSGNVVVYDRNGYIKKLIDDEVIQTEGTPVDIVLNGNVVQHHISSDNSYDKNTKQLTMFLGNKIKDWSVLTYKGFPYPKGTVEEAKRTAYEVLYDVMYTLYGSVWTDYSVFDSMLDGFVVWGNANSKSTIKEYLSVVEIEYPYIEAGRTYRDVIDEFCNMLQLNVYVVDNGFKFVSARPIIDSTETKIINIPLKNLYSEFNETIIPKNKYSRIELPLTKVSEEYDYDSVVHSANETVVDYSVEEITIDNLNVMKSDQDSDNTTTGTGIDEKPFAYAFCALKNYYYTGQVKIPLEKNSNLTQILKINNSVFRGEGEEKTPAFTITYREEEYDIFGDVRLMVGLEEILNFTKVLKSSSIKSGMFSMSTSSTASAKGGGALPVTATAFASVSVENNSMCSVVKDEGSDCFVFSYTLLAGQNEVNLTSSGYSFSIVTEGPFEGKYYRRVPISLEVSVYGNKRTIYFNDVQVQNEEPTNSGESIHISAGRLLQSGTFLNKEIAVAENIKNTIFSDYSKGVPTAHFTVCCGNYYYKDGAIAIDWSKGQILKCEDLITLDNDFDKNGNQRRWRITGVEFVYDNEPLLEIDVIQVTPIETMLPAGLYRAGTNEILYTWEELLALGFISVDDYDGSLDIDGLTILNADTQNLSGDLYISGSVVWIGESAFLNYNAGESNLSAVYLPNSVRGISDKAFVNNDKIIKVKLPLSLNKLGSSAFSQCSSVQNVSIPAGITVIEGSCFHGCYGFSEIEIPFGVERLDRNAFSYCINAKSVYIPDSVTSIGNESLAGLHSVNSIYIPISVVEMLGCPFFGNNNPAFTIYCGASEKPSGWSDEWNLYEQGSSKVFNVKWGYTRQQYEEEIKNL